MKPSELVRAFQVSEAAYGSISSGVQQCQTVILSTKTGVRRVMRVPENG